MSFLKRFLFYSSFLGFFPVFLSCQTISSNDHSQNIGEKSPEVSSSKVSPEAIPNLLFSIGECDEKINPYSPPPSGILDQKWKDETTLVVESFVKTFCGGVDISGNYSLNGDSVVVKYSLQQKEVYTRCICAHKLTYEISNIEKKDYTVSIFSESADLP